MTTLMSCLFATAVLTADASPDRWEGVIRAFEEQDKVSAPAKDGIVFVGSSSIRLWDLKKGLPDLPCTNRGFGGSHMGDSAHFAERIVIPYRPRVVVVFAGGNDIASGKSPEQVAEDFKSLVSNIHAALPKTKVFFVSLYPTIGGKRSTTS